MHPLKTANTGALHKFFRIVLILREPECKSPQTWQHVRKHI